MTGESPFKRDQEHETQNAILECDFDLGRVECAKAKSFITGCLVRDPSKRQTCVDLLASEWFCELPAPPLRSKKRSSNSSDLVSPLISPRDELEDPLNPLKRGRFNQIVE